MALRAEEIVAVQEALRSEWLAGQLDEVAGDIAGVRSELVAIRRVLTGILVGVICAVVTIPVGIIWASAVAG